LIPYKNEKFYKHLRERFLEYVESSETVSRPFLYGRRLLNIWKIWATLCTKMYQCLLSVLWITLPQHCKTFVKHCI